ncbi:uncharacterized protein LOC129577475 [Sitodiplosis mosellana]|uniref:uncharacterized protein LOC129577475 n=1 Tax=Sitodiplosis mosellana TaxID=263140 RepID=UPI0024449153|nr:uncharacterized protein LOC129577475 [Sitodiplosis mosellana]
MFRIRCCDNSHLASYLQSKPFIRVEPTDKMNKSKTHQEQNTILAKAVNHLKMELRKSKHEVSSLRHQLQVSREQNVQMAVQQTTLFETIGQFENNLDEVFANNSFAYVLLSTSIKQITAKNPRRSNVSAIDVSTSTEINSPMNGNQSTTVDRPHQSTQDDDKDDADILNTAFLVDSEHVSDESIELQRNDGLSTEYQSGAVGVDQKLIKKPSRLPVPLRRSVNFKRNVGDFQPSANDSNQTVMLTRRKRKIVDYREQPINRKMRRSG